LGQAIVSLAIQLNQADATTGNSFICFCSSYYQLFPVDNAHPPSLHLAMHPDCCFQNQCTRFRIERHVSSYVLVPNHDIVRKWRLIKDDFFRLSLSKATFETKLQKFASDDCKIYQIKKAIVEIDVRDVFLGYWESVEGDDTGTIQLPSDGRSRRLKSGLKARISG
jgi:hypothetical protein